MSARGDRHTRRMAARLSAFHDGDLGWLRTALMHRHLRSCPPCQQVLRALEEQVAALRALREPEPSGGIEPDEAGWRALEQALRAAPPPRPPRVATPWPRLVGVLAGGAALLLLAWRGGLLEQPPSEEQILGLAAAEFREAELHYERAVEQLLRVSRRARRGWSPAEVRAFEERLGELHQATHRRRLRARQEPADAASQEALLSAYRTQILFLQASLRQQAPAAPASPGAGP